MERTYMFVVNEEPRKIKSIVPNIYFSRKAIQDIDFLVNYMNKEISWLGTVETGEDYLYITEIFLPDQDVGIATTEITEKGVADVCQSLINEGRIKEASSLLFWGHSHVEMGVFASGQDEEQVKLWKKNKCPFMIRGIFNKKEEALLDLFLFEKKSSIANIERVDNIKWEVWDPMPASRKDFWKGEIEKKVREFKYVSMETIDIKQGNLYNFDNTNHYNEKKHKKNGPVATLLCSGSEVLYPIKEKPTCVSDAFQECYPTEYILWSKKEYRLNTYFGISISGSNVLIDNDRVVMVNMDSLLVDSFEGL